jgi:transposase InsO family protein
MCRVLKVHQSGYYRWLKSREGASREGHNRLLSVQIKSVFGEFKGRYGSPRLCRELRQRGMVANHKRVARLMRDAGLRAKSAKRFKVTTQSRHRYPVAANLLERRFEVTVANSLWVSDITYVWTQEGWLYVAVVLEAYSRRVVGWSWSKTLGADLAVRALKRALQERAPAPGWMHHSDRGVQYVCGAYQEVLRASEATVSMSRKGNCWDNALAESFFATLKKELIQGENYRTRQEAVSAIWQYIEVFYNRQRKHSKLGYQSPVEFEEKQTNIKQNHPIPTLYGEG